MAQALAIWQHNTQGRIASAHPLAAALSPLLRPHFDGLSHELLVILGCDSRHRLLSFVEYRGQGESIDLALPAFRSALAPERVSLIVLAHNHPCGSPNPSQADCEATRRIAALCRLAGVSLVDHLIFAGPHVSSFRALGLL